MMAKYSKNSNSGAADRIPVQCSSLRKNDYVMLKEKPCKIVDMKKHQTGKHGHTKVGLTRRVWPSSRRCSIKKSWLFYVTSKCIFAFRYLLWVWTSSKESVTKHIVNLPIILMYQSSQNKNIRFDFHKRFHGTL